MNNDLHNGCFFPMENFRQQGLTTKNILGGARDEDKVKTKEAEALTRGVRFKEIDQNNSIN